MLTERMKDSSFALCTLHTTNSLIPQLAEIEQECFSHPLTERQIEAGADAQKSAAKKVNPKRFVDNGLYKLVRCPNYLGELVIWTGCLLSGIGAGLSVWQWIIALAGYVGIIYVMFSGARRLELRQEKVYGNNPEFQEYVRKTPILLPFIPLYSVAKYEWLRA